MAWMLHHPNGAKVGYYWTEDDADAAKKSSPGSWLEKVNPRTGKAARG